MHLNDPGEDYGGNISETSPLSEANTPAKTTIIGPVGPEICEGVPPNSAAKNPDNNGAVDASNGSRTGGLAKRQCQRQRYDLQSSRQNVAPEVREQNFCHGNLLLPHSSWSISIDIGARQELSLSEH